jgi:hypothetical protein
VSEGSSPGSAWLRAAAGLDRAAATGARIVNVAVEETVRAWVAPEERAGVTRDIYEREVAYRRGGAHFERGLFDWEARALATTAFPRKGRFLVGAAGGGREMRALLDAGYEVAAFEPSALVEEARVTARPYGARARVAQASYEDLAAAVRREGPIAEILGDDPVDAVVLGWISLSNLTDPHAHRALFRALHALAPAAPVLSSYSLVEPARGRAESLRPPLRRLYSKLGAPGAPDNVRFFRSSGFLYQFTVEELQELFAANGYRIVYEERAGQPNCIVVPG